MRIRGAVLIFGGRYQFALGPPARSLVTSIALARFILQDELVPAFTCANLMGRKSPSYPSTTLPLAGRVWGGAVKQ